MKTTPAVAKIFLSLFFIFSIFLVSAQKSVARLWNDQLIESIRKDFARPTVHARNLFHLSAASYDAWAVFDNDARTYFLGQTVGGFNIPFNGFTPGPDIQAQRNQAISYAMYRLLLFRFRNSPDFAGAKARYEALMAQLGYDKNFTSTNYSSGNAAALGNYIADRVIAFGKQDGSNELNLFQNTYYTPVNQPLIVANPGNPAFIYPNRWQQLALTVFVDQSGNQIPTNTPPFMGAEWGNVVPFSLADSIKNTYQRDGDTYQVYRDPGPPAFINPANVTTSADYKRTFGLVAQWSSHLDIEDGVSIDISPASIGNVPSLPAGIPDYESFYDYMEGGDAGLGRSVNPVTGQAYQPQMVLRGDYSRVLAEFWADGPTSETPPGHWFTIFNYVTDHPQFVRKYKGQGQVIDALEWDVKGYFMMGGAMHDAAISTWSIKGYYDYVRPISAIRYMAGKGQCTDPMLPSYHPAGINLVPGFMELVAVGDPLAGASNEHVGKIKMKSWRGPDYITDPAVDHAGVGWILAENWWPYQRPTFVTPPFAGYISGHSTFSRTAAEVMTFLTGNEYFPGGMGEFIAKKNEYLVFEEGPSQDIILQWATYRDASDQCSLSRIWGGIHPPVDDIPGRKNGIEISKTAIIKAESYFFGDDDADGYLSDVDCNDGNANIHPGAAEICDLVDNDCDGIVDGPVDFDGDGNADNCDADDDNDGVTDALDECAQTAAGINTTPNGCADNDKDGFNPEKSPTDPLYDANDNDACIPLQTSDYCDADNDGLTNLEELNGADGLPSSGDETDPTEGDTDGDGFNDGLELLTMLTNPLDACSPFRPNAGCGSELSGIAFNDLNYDGQYGFGDGVFSGLKVELFDRIYVNGHKQTEKIATTFTDNNGAYSFSGVVPGSYFIAFEMKEGYNFTKINAGPDGTDSDVTEDEENGSTDLFIITGNTGNLTAIYAGLYECNYIGDLVWYDIDKDDVADPTENGINGIPVELYRFENGNYVLFDISYTGQKPNSPSSDGYFSFCAPPGQYYIRVLIPPYGLVSVVPNVGSNEEIDSDITHFFGKGTSHPFTVGGGQDKTDLGAGFYPMATVGNLVWMDEDGNGFQDNNEAGISGVKVEVYDEEDQLAGSSVTNDQGIYTLDYLEKKKYYFKFYPPAGLATTVSNDVDDNKNSDVDHSNGLNTTRLLALKSGDAFVNIDAGLAFGALPLEWKSFEGQRVGECNLLQWETSVEQNCDRFELERKIDGTNLFDEIYQVTAHNSETGAAYDFCDENSLAAYYRVKQIDRDGRYKYSKTLYLKATNEVMTYRINPNPGKNSITLVFNGLNTENKVSVKVLNSAGVVVKEAKAKSESLVFENIISGVYHVVVDVDGVVTSIKAIVIE